MRSEDQQMNSYPPTTPQQPQPEKQQLNDVDNTILEYCQQEMGGLFECQHCKKSFKKKSKMERHIKQLHLNITPHQCLLCQKSFKRIQHLERHQSCHSEQKPVSCFECEKSFKNKEQMTRHFKLQHLKKVIQCGECGEQFLKKRSLKKHEKQHHQIVPKPQKLGKKIEKSKRKMYLCSVKDCGKVFDNHFALKRHYTKVHRYNESVELFSSENVNSLTSQQKQFLFSINPGSSLGDLIQGIEVEIEMVSEEEEEGEGDGEEEDVIYQEEEDLLLNC